MAQIDPEEVEQVEVSKDGYAIGLDLVQLESTRFGLELIGVGVGLSMVFGGLPMVAPGPAERVLAALATLAKALAIIGLVQTAPTPNGFLPMWLRRLFIGVLSLGLIDLLADRLVSDLWTKFFAWTQVLPVHLIGFLVTLSFPWILWRFCQHRGLIGRAITWLWLALIWSVLGAIVFWNLQGGAQEIHWASGLSPAIGVLFAVTTHYTARDIWLDAVNRKTKKIVGARPEPEPEPESAA